MLQIKRVYETATGNDGYRVLVDRLWPRGMTKEKAAVDLWLKEVAPSTELRQWFNHDPVRFEEFKLRYLEELGHNPAMARLTGIVKDYPTVTLVYAAKDPAVNHAVVLRDSIK